MRIVITIWAILISCLSINSARAEISWTAYNDCIGTTIHSNVSSYSNYSGFSGYTSGQLIDIATGNSTNMPTVTFSIPTDQTLQPLIAANYGANPDSGTDAWEIFDGIIDFSGTILQHCSSCNDNCWYVDITFSQLDPDSKYTFAATAFRNSDYGTSRITDHQIISADNYTNTSSTGIFFAQGDTTKLLAADNSLPGYVVKWENIKPGSDGTFTIHTFPDALSGGDGRHGYPLAGFMLQEITDIYTNDPPIVDAGQDQTISLFAGSASTTLTPSISDDSLNPEFTPTVSWQLADGPDNISFYPDNTTSEVTVSFPTQGEYIIELTATDDIGQSSADTVTINVVLSNSENCPEGDINSDCVIDIEDMELIAEYWLSVNTNLNLTGDDDISMPDFAIIADNWQSQNLSKVVISEFSAINSYIPFINSTNIYTRYPWANTSLNNVNPDWIEIYNGSSETVNLSQWYLTDDSSDLTKWQFPIISDGSMDLAPGKFMIIFASGKTEDEFPDNFPFIDAYGSLHTNFSLGSDGEYLAIVEPDGQTISYCYDKYPKQFPFTTYGITRTGNQGYLKEATAGTMTDYKWPGQANSQAYDGIVEEVEFNRKRGFYTEEFEVVLSCPTEQVIIRYTKDGTEPTESSPIFFQPLTISSTTCLKAKAFRNDYLPGATKTMSYIFLDDVVNQNTPADSRYILDWGDGYLGDYAMENDTDDIKLVAGSSSYTVDEAKIIIRDALLALPTLSISTAPENLFGDLGIYNHSTESGIAWERPASAEFFNSLDDEEDFLIDCGIRIQGGASRNPDKNKHSMSLRFRGGYGYSTLNYKLFSQTILDEFNSLQLRAMYNNSWTHWDAGQRNRGMMIRDQFIRDCLLDMGDKSAGAGRYIHLYLNGLYWGIYNIHERPEASHYAAYFGGESDYYDAINGGEVNDGTYTDWSAFKTLIQSAVSSRQEDWESILQNVKLNRYIDWTIMQHYGGNDDLKTDGNWKAAGGGLFNEPWHYYAWDSERTMEKSYASIDSNLNSWPFLDSYLSQFTEFKVMFADRLYKHLYNDGPLSDTNTKARWLNRKSQLDQAIIAESARWGDNKRTSPPYTRNNEWLSENTRVLGYISSLTTDIVTHFQGLGWYPLGPPPTFYINGNIQHGGEVSLGDTFTMTNPNAVGTMYYTTDGSDPREYWTGNPIGEIFTSPLTITDSITIKARVYYNGDWSALHQTSYSVGDLIASLRISEIMFNPYEGDTEYIELTNISDETVSLNGVSFTDGIEFNFGPGTLEPGQYVLVVQDDTAFMEMYPDFTGTIAGTYSGKLNNSGETISLNTIDGEIIQQFTYSDKWFPITDGEGFSLTIKSLEADVELWNNKDSWRPSAAIFGSPGYSDDGEIPVSGTIIINEILAHSHDEAPDWIELYNTTDQPVNIGGWYLSDDNDDTASIMKYRIPDGTVIEDYSYLVFYQNSSFGDINSPGCIDPFALSDDGESVFLYSGENDTLTGYVEKVEFEGSLTGESFGRYYTSDGSFDFVTMAQATPEEENSLPKVGPIVITEIMYNPMAQNGDSYDKDDYEYLQLTNITSDEICFETYVEELGSNVSWIISDAIEFTFPSGICLDAGESIYIAKDIEAFEQRYQSGLNVIGPYDGKLSNGGETIELSMPGEYDNNTQAYILVESIKYLDGSPWPDSADGDGDSLIRIENTLYGNDYINWQGQSPSAQ